MIDGGVSIDLEAVRQNIGEAEVISVYFPALNRALLVDTRTASGVEVYIGIVPMARGSADRMRSIVRLRPQLPQPQSITTIPWMRRVRSLVTCGVWEQVLARIDDHAAAEECFDVLYALEMSEIRDAIVGHEYNTIWSRQDARR